VFAADLADYQAFNTVYRTFFTREFPARAFLGAGSLLNNARFEVLGIAARR
jgi:2-iminobutanoate/2-iminopropanoate deaminase